MPYLEEVWEGRETQCGQAPAPGDARFLANVTAQSLKCQDLPHLAGTGTRRGLSSGRQVPVFGTRVCSTSNYILPPDPLSALPFHRLFPPRFPALSPWPTVAEQPQGPGPRLRLPGPKFGALLALRLQPSDE